MTEVPQHRETAVRTILADDHAITRASLAALLGAEMNLELCGEATTVPEALRLVRKTPVDLLVTEIAFRDGDGLALIGDAVRAAPALAVVVLSRYEDPGLVERAIRAGARGYVAKHETPAELLQAVKLALRGEIRVNRELGSRIMKRLFTAAPAVESPIDRLTDREFQVFFMLGRGLAPKDIARQLYVSAKTVETYIGNIKAKLELANGRQVFLAAVRESEALERRACGRVPFSASA